MKKNFKKCVSGGQEWEDRTPKEQSRFEPVSIEIQDPDTAILLLKSPEKPILLAAAAALSRFGEKTKGNLEALFDLNVVENVLTLIEHEDLYTRRFSLKLLALMTTVQNVQAHLLKTDTYIMLFIEILSNETDTFLQEFSSRILADLSSDPFGAVLILEKISDLSILFQKLNFPDPDIKKNCIEILNNLLKDLNGFNIISSCKDFNFAALYELFSQPYAIIQNLTLNVIESFLSYNTDDGIYEKFRTSEGVESLLELLNREDWNDLHCKLLHILHLCCDNLKTAEYINKTDAIRQLISLMENTKTNELKFEALNVLVRLAGTLNGRKSLHSQELVKYIMEYLKAYEDLEIHAIICEGISKMTQYAPAAIEIMQENPIAYILQLLNNSNASCSQRQAAAFALKELFASNLQNCLNFLEINGHNYLIKMIEQSEKDVLMETQVTTIEAIIAIVDYPTIVLDLIEFNLFQALFSALEPEKEASDEVKIASLNALARFPINEETRMVLVQTHAIPKLFRAIAEAESVPLQTAASHLVLLFAADSFLANLCNQQGFLVYMLKNRAAARVITTWDSCIEALFSADLPMKFAYTGRLSLHDVTKDGFYVLRHSSCPFPVLEELFRLKLCPLEPIYVVNFKRPKNLEEDDFYECEEIAMEEAREVMRRESLRKGMCVSEGTMNAWVQLKFGKLQIDYDLIGYLELFKTELQVAENKEFDMLERSIPGMLDVSKIALRARKLGEFVVRQLSGTDPSNRFCIDQQLELHLRRIKDKIQTSIIPLGLLRVGSSLERSLLFKVMADRIALPTSLVRGRYGKSWVEVAVPIIETSYKNQSFTNLSNMDVNTDNLPKFRALPTKYLHENFIVDLTRIPGDLIPIKSNRGRRYHDATYGCEFLCCE